MVPLPFSLPVVPSQRSSACPSSASTSPLLSSVFHRRSWGSSSTFFSLGVLLILITSATSISVGPAYAIPRVLQLTGLTISDVDFYEINEAFASQAVYSVKELGIPFEKVNVWGGAIALGHPLGCSK